MTAGQPDPLVIRRHLAALSEALANLRRHSGRTVEELRANSDLRWTVERGLQLCAQNVLDIATHVAAASGRDSPDYSVAIDRLAELRVLPGEFAATLRPIAGFRNVLVHGYTQVDLAVVVQVLAGRLGDFETFARHIETFLQRG